MDRIRYMVTFAHVVEAGSFVGAADKLQMTPSVASKHVAKLEQELGVRLLNRSTRNLSLTEAGASLYEHCRRIVEELAQSEQAVAQLQAEPQGHLRITTMTSISSSLLAPMIPGFLEEYPKIELEIVASDHIVNLTEEGYDLALRITGDPPQQLVARQLAPVRFVVCGAPAYFRKRGRPETLAELQQHVCLNYPSTLARNWVFARDNERIEVPIKSPLQINNVDALRQVALAGSGLALLPVYAIVTELQAGSLECVLPDYRGFGEANLYAVYPQNRYGSPKLKAFVEFFRQYIAGLRLDAIGCPG